LVYQSYDFDGRITAVADTNPQGLAASERLGLSAHYQPTGEMDTAHQDDGNAVSFTYDEAVGNITRVDNDSVVDDPRYFDNSVPHHATRVYEVPPGANWDISYDASGAMQSLPGARTLAYDARGRVQQVQANASTIATYQYDADGLRTAV